MDEIEDYSESVHDQSNEHAEKLLQAGKEKWVLFVALTTAVVAVLAAIAGLLAGDHADEAMLAQMKASDNWAFYQAKGIKTDILNTSNSLMIAMGKQPIAENVQKIQENKTEQDKIKETAKDAQKESDGHVAKHKIFARCVTLFQISIAISAISIITKRRILWFAGMGFTLVGIIFLITGLL